MNDHVKQTKCQFYLFIISFNLQYIILIFITIIILVLLLLVLFILIKSLLFSDAFVCFNV